MNIYAQITPQKVSFICLKGKELIIKEKECIMGTYETFSSRSLLVLAKEDWEYNADWQQWSILVDINIMHNITELCENFIERGRDQHHTNHNKIQ